VEARQELVDPANQIQRTLSHVDDPDEHVCKRLKEEKDSVEHPIQAEVQQVPGPDKDGGHRSEPELCVDLPNSAEELEAEDQGRWQEVWLIADALARGVPVAIDPHVDLGRCEVLLTVVVGIQLNVTCELVKPKLIIFFFLSHVRRAFVLLAGLI